MVEQEKFNISLPRFGIRATKILITGVNPHCQLTSLTVLFAYFLRSSVLSRSAMISLTSSVTLLLDLG